jgi:hypothetical protein
LGGAGFCASRLFVVFEPFNTEITLYCYFLIIIKLHSPERTGPDAFLAANAQLLIDEYDSPLIPGNRFYWARILAGGLRTMVAIEGDKGGGSFNHPDQPWTHAKPMFLLACHLTGMTTHTIILKKDQRNLFHGIFLLLIIAA